MKSSLVLFPLILILFCCICNASKLLLLTPLGAKSHLNAYMGMFKPLAEKGHQLTVVSAYGSSKNEKNIKHVVLPSKYSVSNTVAKNVFTDGGSGPLLQLLLKSPELCVESLSTDLIQDLKKEKFDLIMISVMSECYYSLIHHFKVPFVSLSPVAVVGILSESMGNPYFVSLSGNVMIEGTYPFGYFYRLKATLFDTAIMSILRFYNYPKSEKLCRESSACPPDMPSYAEIRANTSLTISNSVKLLQPNRAPDMPHIIYSGGSHCGPAKPLPQDLENWVQGSGENGFIFFSLGSVVTPSEMPESARKIFVKVFGKLKQRVLWKWDKEMDDLPSNVKLQKWLPQQDILGHTKLKLFITHGGLLSIMESTYHGARILGMPLFVDQYSNIKEGVINGWAESLYWEDLTEEALENKILSVVNNKRMDEIVANRAVIMNDLPRSPREEVIYWIEYVIRHKGATHLRSPLHHMPLYVLYNVDVWLTLILCLCGFIGTICFTCRTSFRYCFRKRKMPNKKKKQ